jgi:RNA polymerase sigma factor (sigma-70 family)
MVQTSTGSGYDAICYYEPTKQNVEETLVYHLKQKCHKSFGELYNNYSGALYKVALDFMRDENCANDVLQEAFINIYRNIDTYNASKSRLYTWMLTITRNICIDTMRSKAYKNNLKNDSLVEGVDVMSASFLPDTDCIGLYKMLEKIKPVYRQIIELYYYKGYTSIEIAEMFAIPLGTVKTRIRAAITQLREIYV